MDRLKEIETVDDSELGIVWHYTVSIGSQYAEKRQENMNRMATF